MRIKEQETRLTLQKHDDDDDDDTEDGYKVYEFRKCWGRPGRIMLKGAVSFVRYFFTFMAPFLAKYT